MARENPEDEVACERKSWCGGEYDSDAPGREGQAAVVDRRMFELRAPSRVVWKKVELALSGRAVVGELDGGQEIRWCLDVTGGLGVEALDPCLAVRGREDHGALHPILSEEGGVDTLSAVAAWTAGDNHVVYLALYCQYRGWLGPALYFNPSLLPLPTPATLTRKLDSTVLPVTCSRIHCLQKTEQLTLLQKTGRWLLPAF